MSLSVYFPLRVLLILTSIASHDMKLICKRGLTHHKDNSLIREGISWSSVVCGLFTIWFEVDIICPVMQCYLHKYPIHQIFILGDPVFCLIIVKLIIRINGKGDSILIKLLGHE